MTEELKMILETVTSLGEIGVKVFLIWLGFSLIKAAGVFVLFGGLALGAFKLANHAVRGLTFAGKVMAVLYNAGERNKFGGILKIGYSNDERFALERLREVFDKNKS